MAVRRPVKLVLSRREDLLSGNPAPQAIIELKTGMAKDGTLTALKGRVIYDTGAFPAAPMLPGLLVLGGYYRCDNLELQGVEVLTNKVSVGALRAPGVPQVTFALENHIDQMASDLGLDLLEVRLKNCVVPGDPLPHGQPYPSIGLRECLERVADTEIWQQRKQAKERGPNRGVGLAIGGWPSAIQPASATVMLNSDGTLNVAVGSTDLTGTNTSFGQIAAEVLNVSPSRISVTTGDTKVAPYSGVSGGSKTLFCTGQAVKGAAEDARQQMLSTVAQRLETQPDELEIVDGVVQIKGSP
jgi:CO/xanthine dehydrogenase Mo-binding subunit